MKCIWEEKDIRTGRRYSRPGLGEDWIIGYLSAADNDRRYCSISTADGLVTAPRSKREFADHLTKEDYLPVELIHE